MPLTIACHQCRQHYAVEERYAGHQVNCPACAAVISIPVPPPLYAPPPTYADVEPVFAQYPQAPVGPASGPYQATDDHEPPPRTGGSLIALALALLLIFLFAGSLIGILVYLAQQEQQQLANNDLPELKEERPKPNPTPPKSETPRVDQPNSTPKEQTTTRSGPKLPPPSDRPWQGHSAAILHVAVDRAVTSLWTASGGMEERNGKTLPALDSTLRRWDVKSGKEVERLEFTDHGIAAAAIDPERKRAAVAAPGKTAIELWDLATKKKLRTLDDHTKPIRCLAFSGDGQRLVSGSDDRRLVVWDVGTGRALHRLAAHTNSVTHAAISPDGRLALSAGMDHTARLWDIERGEAIRELTRHDDIIWATAFSPDGAQALTGGGQHHINGDVFVAGAKDYEVRLWDISAAKEKSRFKPLNTPVTSLTFSPDGRRFLAGGLDGSVRLWQIDGKQIKRLDAHTKRIRGLAFLGGQRAVSVGDDGAIRIWDLPAGLSELVRDLKSKDDKARLVALAELAGMGTDAKPAIPALFDALAGADEPFRSRVLNLLRTLAPIDREHIAHLEKLLNDRGFAPGRLFALDQLTRLGKEARPAAKSLLAAASDRDVAVRRKALEALISVVSEVEAMAFKPLFALLRDEDAQVRENAERALDRLGKLDIEHLPTLRTLLSDDKLTPRRFAIRALGELGEKAEPAVSDLVERARDDDEIEVRQLALKALSKIAPTDRRVVESATRALDNKNAALARVAAKILADAGDVPGLVKALDHADAEVLKTAGTALDGAKFTKKHLPLLIKMIESEQQPARKRGVEALPMLGADASEAIPALSKAMKAAETEEQKRILNVLRKLGRVAKSAGPTVAELLRTKDSSRRFEVIEVLLKIEASEVSKGIAFLIEQLRPQLPDGDDEEATKEALKQQERARGLLVQIGKPALQPLVSAVTEDFSSSAGPSGALNGAARLAAVKAFGEMGPTAKNTPVMRLLAKLQIRANEPFPAVREAARLAYIKVQKKRDDD